MAPRETENNAYAKFWGDKQRTLWYMLWYFWSGQLQNWFIMDCREWDSLMHICKITKDTTCTLIG